MRGICILITLLAVTTVAACSAAATDAPSAAPAAESGAGRAAIIVEDPWVRTTDGAKDTTMTAAFLTLVNPGETDITLTRAEATDVAGMTQLHRMEKRDGKMVMVENPDGVVIPAGSHAHLAPGSDHIMLMQLSKNLPVGEQVTIHLTYSNGESADVTAPVKKFTEEEPHYHASPSPTS